jgi:hypothetical protein
MAAVKPASVLCVTGDELVQDRPLGRATPVPAERLSCRAGRSFVQATGEHTPAP